MNQTDIPAKPSEQSEQILQVLLNEKGEALSCNTIFAEKFPTFQCDGCSHFASLLSPNDDSHFNNLLKQCLVQPGDVMSASFIHLFDNEQRPILWRVTYLKIADSGIISLQGEILSRTDSASDLSHTLQNIFNYSVDIICAIDEAGKFVTISQACFKIWGYQPEELIGEEVSRFIYSEDVAKTLQVRRAFRQGKEINEFENRYLRKDGSLVTMLWTAKWNDDDKMMYCVAREGTQTKAFEKFIKSSEEKYKLLFYKNPQPMWIYDVNTLKFLEVNEASIDKYGYTRDEFLSMTIKDIRTPEEVEKLLIFEAQTKTLSYKTNWKHKKKDGQIIDVEITAFEFDYENTNAKLVLSNDITKHLLAEKELLKSNERYLYASKASFDAIWDWNLRTNQIDWSENYLNLYGYAPEGFKESLNDWMQKIHFEDKERVEKVLLTAIDTEDEIIEDEFKFKKADGSYAHVSNRGTIIRNKHGNAYRMIGVLHDFSEKEETEKALKKLNASLEKRASELFSSNQELERFAYVASHDLQEPLRMVSSFLQLLQKRYKAQLDAKANEYIHFAVDGAERMKTLILDLLKYSRVNTMKEAHEQVNMNDICSDILFTFKQQIQETKALVEIAPLPTLLGTKTQLIQLLQNLIGNALKYRGINPPIIKIGCTEINYYWKFFVEDNGIGIDPRFYEKIFIIFQRLHHKDEYSGTGIGLAICKKIVERHGGKIWVESTSDNGSIFYFTIRKNLQSHSE